MAIDNSMNMLYSQSVATGKPLECELPTFGWLAMTHPNVSTVNHGGPQAGPHPKNGQPNFNMVGYDSPINHGGSTYVIQTIALFPSSNERE